MIAARRPPLPIDHPEAVGPIPDDVVEMVAEVLLAAAARQERLLSARAAEQDGNADKGPGA